MATIKLNGVDQPLSPITGTDLNDKLTVDGESLDSILATLGKGKDLVEITNGSTDSPAFTQVDNNITVNGGDGDDTFQATDGLVTLTGKLNGVAGNDDISITSAKGATVQGGLNADTVTAGTVADLNVAGSNANAVISDSSILGGDGADTVSTLNSAELTDSTVVGGGGHDDMSINGSLNGTSEVSETADGAGNTVISAASFIKGGDGKDHITLVNGASIVNTLVAGNANADHIKAGELGRGSLTDSTGSLITGGAGDDLVEVALAGEMTVKGGAGKDFLRVGSGQVVNGGQGADVFSIEGKGGATIEDFDAMDEDCFCSDVIQVDGNKLFYDTYDYKPTKQLYTSASSWAGNIKVKAVAEAETCNVGTQFTFNASKTANINATAVVKWKATAYDSDATSSDFQVPAFPKSGSYVRDSAGFEIVNFSTNGNSPRPTADVKGIGFGFATVEGLITNKTTTANGNNRRTFKIRNVTAYTSTQFEKGDFSFLNLTKKANDDCDLTQTLVFNKVSQATITNHWASFGISKKVDTTTLYNLEFGTANFYTVMTGKANLIITNVEDKTYTPTQGQYTNTKLTKLTRTANAGAGATITLNLENDFDLFTKRNDFEASSGVGYGKTNGVSTILGTGTAGGFIKYSDVTYAEAQSFGLLTLNVATNMFGVVTATDDELTRGMNHFSNPDATGSGTFDGNFATTSSTSTTFIGKSGGARDTQTAKGSLIAKIFVQETKTANDGTAGLSTWVERAIIPGQVFEPTDNCFFPSTLNADVIAGNGNNNGKYTPASGGAFGTKLVWDPTSGLLIGSLSQSNSPSSIGALNHWGTTANAASNGCTSSQFACSSYARSDNASSLGAGPNYASAQEVFGKLNSLSNDGAFSGSSFNVKVLAADGMGDNVSGATVEGAPFRILFFDTKGSDNGLYMYSGTANYKNGDVTAVNTDPVTSSAMGTKQTIVKVTGGKGYEIALSDINLV